MKKGTDTARTPEEIAAEERRRRRSEAAKKGAATKRAKAEAAKQAEEAKAKAEAEEKSSSTAAVVVDGTGASASATNDEAKASAVVAGDGTKAEAKTANDGTSSSAVIVLPAGDTGKNDRATPSATFVAPATNSDNHETSEKEEKGEGPMSKVLKFLGWALALVLLAALIVVLLTMKGCTGAQSTTPSAISVSATADAEAKISALSAALAAKDAENASLREQLASQQAPVNVNVDNSNTVVVDNTAVAEAQAEARAWQDKYYQLFDHCTELEVINGNFEVKCAALEDECAELRAREPGTSVVYVDRDVVKTITVVDTDEVDRLTAELASVKADLAWALDQLAKLQEEGPSIVYRDREVVKTVKDTEEIDRLNSVIASLNARISELEAQISSHVCPEAGVEYVEVPVYYPEYVYIYVPTGGGSGTPEYTSTQPDPVWPGEGDGSTITSPDRSGGSITGGN